MPRLPVAVTRLPVLWAAFMIIAGPATLVLLPQAARMEHMRAESRAGVLWNGACAESSAFAAVSSWRWQLQNGVPSQGPVGEATPTA